MNFLRIFVLIVLHLGLAKACSAGSPRGMSYGRVHYIGIGCDTLFICRGVECRSPFSCGDVARVAEHLKKWSNENGTAEGFNAQTSCRDNTRQKLSSFFREVGTNSRSDDYFVFYFGGYTDKVTHGGRTSTAFFLKPPCIDSDRDKTLDSASPSDYFTLAELRIWMNAIPARNQLVLIEAGFTAELRDELYGMLMETDKNLSDLERRKRVLLFPRGVGIEDKELKAGRFTWTMTTGLDSQHINLLDVFSADKQDVFETYCWRSYFLPHTDRGTDSPWESGFNLVKEWELQRVVKRISESGSGPDRNDNVILNNGSNRPRDTLPHFYALLCGTDEYAYLPQLGNPVFDAVSMAQELSSHYGFETRVLKNPKTVNDFVSAIKYYSDSVAFGPRDELLVFVAGHGVYNEFSQAGFMAFGNSLPSAQDPGMTTWFEHRRLAIVLNNLKCKKIMLVLDVCYGGSMSLGLESSEDPRLCNPSGSYPKGVWPFLGHEAGMVYKNLNCASRVYLTSSGFQYIPDGTPGSHSPFVALLLSELQNATMQVSTSSELYNKVKRTLETDDAQLSTQQPTYGRFGLDNNSTDFVFVRKP